MTFDNESNDVSNGLGEYVERDSNVILDDVRALADRLKYLQGESTENDFLQQI